MRALIVEQGNSRGALSAARALRARGWFVGIGSPLFSGVASASASCSARHDIPPAHEDIDTFIEAVATAITVNGYEVVFGAGEAEVVALSLRRHALDAVVPYGTHDGVMAAVDKIELDERARAAGFSTPTSVDPAAIPAGSSGYAVKARFHSRPERQGLPPRVDTNVVWGDVAAARRVEEVRELGAEPYVQRFHEGRLLAYSAVVDRRGAVIADCMQIGDRIWPPHAGASCRSVSVPVDPTVEERARRLFDNLGWFGLAELQFVLPGCSTDPLLIDFNGRFYGSLSLAVKAGANLPLAWAAVGLGLPVERARARPGVRYQWLEGDVRRAWVERRGGVVTDLVDTLRWSRGAVHSVIDITDPRPAAIKLKQVLRRAAPVEDRNLRKRGYPKPDAGSDSRITRG